MGVGSSCVVVGVGRWRKIGPPNVMAKGLYTPIRTRWTYVVELFPHKKPLEVAYIDVLDLCLLVSRYIDVDSQRNGYVVYVT